MFDIKQLDVRNDAVFKAILDLQVKAFGEFAADLARHILVDSHLRSVMYGAYDGDRLVGTNAFTAHGVSHAGVSSLAYQSCMSATDPDYRGKGIFVALVEHAKKALKADGGAFIFGYPNGNSGPIFRQKLSFDVRPMSVVYLPLKLGAAPVRWLLNTDKMASQLGNGKWIGFDARANSEWKVGRPGRQTIESIEHYTNFIFGRTVSRRLAGRDIKMIHVGGYEINKPPLFSDLLRDLGRKTGASVARFVVPLDAPLSVAASYRRDGESTEPLITFPLNWDVSDKIVDAPTGLKDVF